MRIAYIISAYKLPRQLVRLVERLNTATASFWVHVDRKTDDRVYRQMVEGLSHMPHACFLPRHTCHWGGFGHVAATLEGMAHLVETGTRYDYCVLLTGQDYPLQSNAAIAAFFQAHAGDIFINYFPLPYAGWEASGVNRIDRWHWYANGWHLAFPPDSRFPLWRRFPRGLRPFGGSSYWCLPRDCVEYVHRFTQRNAAFVRFFHRVAVPDEMFFQTIILNSPLRQRAVNDDLRYIDWKDPDAASPAILGRDDWAALSASAKLFARKFDPTVDAAILDLIDARRLCPTPSPLGADRT